MESPRVVHIYNRLSGETLGVVRQRPADEWRTFIGALHYYVGRMRNVPVWCVELLWKYDPWDEAQLPTKMSIQYKLALCLK